MEKIVTLLLVAMLCVLFTACGGSENKPSESIEDIGDGGISQSADQSEQSLAGEKIPSKAGQPKVEIKSDRVCATVDDGLGNISITEYIYKNGTLSEIVMTMQCTDNATAKMLYDSYVTGEMKEYAAELYSNMKQNGKNLVLTFKESYQSSFVGFTMEQLAALLENGDPFSGGNGGTSDNASGGGKLNTCLLYTSRCV